MTVWEVRELSSLIHPSGNFMVDKFAQANKKRDSFFPYENFF